MNSTNFARGLLLIACVFSFSLFGETNKYLTTFKSSTQSFVSGDKLYVLQNTNHGTTKRWGMSLFPKSGAITYFMSTNNQGAVLAPGTRETVDDPVAKRFYATMPGSMRVDTSGCGGGQYKVVAVGSETVTTSNAMVCRIYFDMDASNCYSCVAATTPGTCTTLSPPNCGKTFAGVFLGGKRVAGTTRDGDDRDDSRAPTPVYYGQ
jgi:hypothetical protein